MKAPNSWDNKDKIKQDEWDRFCAQQKRMWEQWKEEMVGKEDATQKASDS